MKTMASQLVLQLIRLKAASALLVGSAVGSFPSSFKRTVAYTDADMYDYSKMSKPAASRA
jgi:hypothetical protein